jgi:group I intron endonuclease
MFWCLYTITNKVNGKQYIGISSRVARRWVEHKSGHGSKLVYQAIKKYGLDSLEFDILCEGCEGDIKKLEVAMIAKHNTLAPNGYNLTEGGEGSTGWKPSAETRKKMSEARSGDKNPRFGKKNSSEHRRKISEKASGRKNPKRTLLNKEFKGAGNPRARRVLVQDVEYDCMIDAAEAIGIKPMALRQRMCRYNKRKTGWPPGWRYLDT